MTSPPKCSIRWESLAVLWQRVSECRRKGEAGKAESRQRAWGCHSLPRDRTPLIQQLAAKPSSVVSIKGMSWPMSAPFMEKTHLKHLPVACQSAGQSVPVCSGGLAGRETACHCSELTLFPRENGRTVLTCVTSGLVVGGSNKLLMVHHQRKRNAFPLHSAAISRYGSKAHICICKIHAAFYSMLTYGLLTSNFFFSSKPYFSA